MTTLNMTVPFAYSAWVRTARKVAVKRSYLETHRFEMPVHEEVDLVFSWTRPDGGRGEIRVVDGAPAILVLRGIGTVVETTDFRFPDLLVRILSSRVEAVAHGQSVKLKGPPRPETVDVSFREDALNALVGECNRLALVNGKLHRSARAPVLMATDGCVRVVEHVLEGEYQHVFRLDEIDFAVQRAAILGNMSISAVERPTMELSSTAWLDDEVFDISGRSGLYAFSKAAARALPNLSIAAMEAFCDLRDARAASPFDRSACMAVAERLLSLIGPGCMGGEALAVARHMIEVDAARSFSAPAPRLPR